MRNMWQISWWGTFNELCHDTSKFCLEIRKEFRAYESDVPICNGSDAPISQEETQDFIEWLVSYGI